MRTRSAAFLLVFYMFCGPVTAADESVIYLRLSDITSLDPGKTTDTYSGEVVANIFEGLVEYRRDTRTFVPQLATKWRTANGGRRWIFTLRQGVTFHDDRPFNAGDVVYSFLERIKRAESEYPQWNLRH